MDTQIACKAHCLLWYMFTHIYSCRSVRMSMGWKSGFRFIDCGLWITSVLTKYWVIFQNSCPSLCLCSYNQLLLYPHSSSDRRMSCLFTSLSFCLVLIPLFQFPSLWLLMSLNINPKPIISFPLLIVCSHNLSLIFSPWGRVLTLLLSLHDLHLYSWYHSVDDFDAFKCYMYLFWPVFSFFLNVSPLVI